MYQVLYKTQWYITITMTARESLTVRIQDNFNASTIVYAITEEHYENIPAFIYKLTFLNVAASHLGFSRCRWLGFEHQAWKRMNLKHSQEPQWCYWHLTQHLWKNFRLFLMVFGTTGCHFWVSAMGLTFLCTQLKIVWKLFLIHTLKEFWISD